jgi:dTDP-4-dehydrorhamnose 3,5-epimerase
MRFRPSEIPDIICIEPEIREDERGFFFESYQKERFLAAGIRAEFVQANHSVSRRGVLRGLHYQIRRPQGKLVWLVEGGIFDAAVDLRRGSAHFGRCATMQLSAADKLALWIPPGFAHGFYALTEQAQVLYWTTDFYDPQGECTLLWNDPALNIAWPLIDGQPPVLSARDVLGRPLSEAQTFA